MKNEITWGELSSRIGVNLLPEKTTVTKKVRRIAEWDDDLFHQSCILNEPTEFALTFADYIDPKLYGVNIKEEILKSEPLKKFLQEHGLDCEKLKLIGTGPSTMVEV